MKILLLITGMGVGGAERQLVDLADGFHEKGHFVKICYLTGPCLVRPNCEDIEILGLNVAKSICGFISAYISLRKIIHDFRPDVVHSHMVHANLIARLVRLSVRIPRLICTAHSNNEGGKFRMLAYRVTDRLADVTTNVSNDAVSAFEAKGATRPGIMLTVTNGIDTVKFTPNTTVRELLRQAEGITNTDRVILAVGRFNTAKDYPNLLHAYKQLLLSGSSAQLWIIGDGELRDEIKRLTEQLALTDQIRFLGIQKNIPDWLNAADVFVLSSAWEGLPLVVGEAMACEKVVVTTNAGGVREFLGEHGFLVPIHNALALSVGLQKALNLSVDDSYNLGHKARERVVEKYSLASTLNKWIGIYSLK